MDPATPIINSLRFILLAVLIGYAAWQDHTTKVKFEHKGKIVECGEVRNKTWLYAPFGLLLTVLDCALNPVSIVPSLISMFATAIIVFAVFYLNGWGGGDAKAFLTIALCLPLSPFGANFPTFMFPINVIVISAVLAVLGAAIRRQSHLRFLPYVFVAMFIALII